MIAIALLGTMVAAGAGTVCMLPAMAQHVASSVSSTSSSISAPASAPVTRCHSPRVPSHPQSADYRCCVGGHSSALLTRIFSSRPALPPLKLSVTNMFVAAGDADVLANASPLSDSPPGIFILRI